MPFPPSVFIIGAQRCGTTTIAHLLDQHPSISLAQPKEPAFFTIHWDKGIPWYRERFRDGTARLLLDATTWYSVAPTDLFPANADEDGSPYHGVPERIHSISPNARFVYMLRAPVSRTYSAYCYYSLAYGRTRTFREAIAKEPFYLRGSDYIGQLRNYLEYFPIDRFHFVILEEFIQEPMKIVDRLVCFLDIEAGHINPELGKNDKNSAYLYNRLGNGLARLLGSRDRADLLRRGVGKLGSENWSKAIDRMLRAQAPPMRPEDRDLILSIFRERNALLAGCTGLDLSLWRS